MQQTILTLHRYFLWAYRMRASAAELGNEPLDTHESKLWHQRKFMFQLLWLSHLYVVIEGWHELQLHDVAIDEMLLSSNADLLRRLRNALFHFSADYLDSRVEQFLNADCVLWANQLHNAWDIWFRDQEDRVANTN